jgi:vacuolar-type H+-ATPase subunit H
MKQIIEEVFNAEKKADEILKKAREKASEIRQSAEKDNLEKMAQAKLKAKELIQKTVDNARTEAQLFRQEKLKQSENEKESVINNEEIIKSLIDKISDIIIDTEIESLQPEVDK